MGSMRRRLREQIGVAAIAAVLLAGLAGVVIPPVARAVPTCAATAGVAGGEWRNYGRDLTNSRNQSDEKVLHATELLQLGVAWSHTGGVFNNTPIVADGCVYLADSSGDVSAHNADTGEQLWSTKLDTQPAAFGGGLISTPAIHGNSLFLIVNRLGSPYLVALDRTTGAPLPGWPVVLDDQENAMSNSSPIVFNDMVFAGFSGNAGPGHNERGGYVIVDAVTGAVKAKHYVISDANFAAGYAGAGVWSTPAIDLESGYAYVGTSNPHSPQLEDARANSLLKIDVDPGRATFGQIVDSYKGLPDTYLPGLSEQPVCETFPDTFYIDRFSASCVQVDLDFGASPTLFEVGGKKVLGGLQKAGVFHAVDPVTMNKMWTQVVGIPCLACNAASPASGAGQVYTAAGPPGQVFKLDGKSGLPGWVGLIHGVTAYNPVTVANGVAYVVDGAGFLTGFEIGTGLPVLKRNMALDTGRFMGSASTSSGIAVARNTIYVAVSDSVIAYKLGASGGGVPAIPGLPAIPGVSGGATIISGPGAALANYLTTTVSVSQGDSVTYTNLDAVQHDVLSKQPGLFGTPLIGIGESADVAGVESLAPGKYGFYCSLHANMKGTLTVTP
jgi:polyvinyl alcohol dehydrogenase (cytochrome)